MTPALLLKDAGRLAKELSGSGRGNGVASQLSTQGAFWFLVFLAPRLLGRHDSTLLLAAIAMAGATMMLSDLGFSSVVLRDYVSAGTKADARQNLAALGVLRLLALVVITPVLAVILYLNSKSAAYVGLASALIVTSSLRIQFAYVRQDVGRPLVQAEIVSSLFAIAFGTLIAAGLIKPSLVSFLLGLIAVRAGGGLFTLFAVFRAPRLSRNSIYSIVRQAPPYMVHRLMGLLSHYSASSLVISVTGTAVLYGYLLGERVFYAGLGVFSLFTPMFVALRREADQKGWRHDRVYGIFLALVFLTTGAAMLISHPIAALISPSGLDGADHYLLIFLLAFPVIASNFFISGFHLQAEGRSWAIARGAAIMAATTVAWLFIAIVYIRSPLAYAATALISEGALLAYYLQFLRRLTRPAFEDSTVDGTPAQRTNQTRPGSIWVDRAVPAALRTVEFLSLPFVVGSREDLLSSVLSAARRGEYRFLVTPNAHRATLVLEEKDQSFYRQADYIVCDSKILLRLAKFLRIDFLFYPGSELTADLFKRFASERLNIALFGPSPEGFEKLVARYPDLALTRLPAPRPFVRGSREFQDCAAMVAAAKWDILFVSLGYPAEEAFGEALRRAGRQGGVALCIGAAIDFLTGDQRRAPKIYQDLGLEWLYRLVSNPRRLWRRYILISPRIVKYLFLKNQGRSSPDAVSDKAI